ncbi:MAG TPA: class II aldolase/adducin family protein [Stellaceae bacterium]|nr:class II aldolase/adducin family protein [Stellaceae bacterium]
MKARVPSADRSAAGRPGSPGTVRDFTDFRPEQRPEPTEQELRQQLAAAYRIVAYFGWDYLIYGHLSVRVPGPERHFLINPFGLMYDEVTASNLVKIDLDGNLVEPGPYTVNPAGFVIHGAIHAARPDAHCVMHTHTIAGMTLAAADVPVRAIDFAGASLYERVAYHAFSGVHADMSDREALVQSLGDKHYLVLRNHGLLTCAPTIPLAFRRLFDLEIACRVQTAATAMNARLIEAPAEIAESHAKVLENVDGGELAFAALTRLMKKRDPSFLE